MSMELVEIKSLKISCPDTLGLDAKADHQVTLWPPNDDTNCHASVPSPPTISTPIRLVKRSLDNALPVGSTGNAAHHLCASGSEHLDEKSGAPWSV